MARKRSFRHFQHGILEIWPIKNADRYLKMAHAAGFGNSDTICMSQRSIHARITQRESPFAFACEIQALLPTSIHSNGFCAIRACFSISLSSSSLVCTLCYLHVPNILTRAFQITRPRLGLRRVGITRISRCTALFLPVLVGTGQAADYAL